MDWHLIKIFCLFNPALDVFWKTSRFKPKMAGKATLCCYIVYFGNKGIWMKAVGPNWKLYKNFKCTHTIKSFLYSKNMMFILGGHLGPYHIWFFIIGQSLMFLIDKEDTFLWKPILWQWNWFFFLIFETHLLVFLHDKILVAVININILHSVNISFEILWIFTAVFIFFLF